MQSAFISGWPVFTKRLSAR